MAKGDFWYKLQQNIKKSLTPSRFVCDKYERQEYETYVLRPGIKLNFTDIFDKKRECVKWEDAPRSATGKSCVEYKYLNSSKEQNNFLYRKIKRHRTVCIEGHNEP